MDADLALQAAQYAYFGCEFQEGLALLRLARPTCASTILAIKCLYECELSSAARDIADQHLAAFADDGAFHYYRGVAHYHYSSFTDDSAESVKIAAESFAQAEALGFGAAPLGRALMALAEQDAERAASVLEAAAGFPGELEHVRARILSLCMILRGDLDASARWLQHGDGVLRTLPGLLLRCWGDVGWIHHYRTRGQFDVAKHLASSLSAQITRERAARLYDSVSEERDQLDRLDCETILDVPTMVPPLAVQGMKELSRKPVLNSLFHLLLEAGEEGLTKDQIARSLWRAPFQRREHHERLHKSVHRLRQMLASSGSASAPILMQRGERYVLVAYRES